MFSIRSHIARFSQVGTFSSNLEAYNRASLRGGAFKYFANEINAVNGLIVDCTKEGWPASIAAVGMALATYPVGVEHNFITREEAIERTLKNLRFFANSEQSTSADATGYKGFYYTSLTVLRLRTARSA